MKVSDYKLQLENDLVPWRLFMPNKSSKEWCVLWLQGWTSSMDSHREGVKRMSSTSGLPFATIDYAGHGFHKLPIEKSTHEQQLNEVVAVFDEIKRLGYKKVIVVGGSFGGYMAALLTGERPVYAVIMRAPASYPDSEFFMPFNKTEAYTDPVAHHHNRAKPNYLHNKALKAIKGYIGFVYVLEHELDSIIDKKIPMNYFTAAKHGNYLVVPKTDHSPKLMPNPQQHFAYIEHLVLSILEEIRLADAIN